MLITKTYKIKVRPESYNWLNKASQEINSVWNYCRWISDKAWIDQKKWLTPFDLIKLVSGTTKANPYLRIGQESINNAAKEYGSRRKQFKKKLRYRDQKKNGWIPFKPTQLTKQNGDRFRFCGKVIRLFEELPNGKLLEGSFSQDSVGDWFFCVPVQLEVQPLNAPNYAIGLDLGLKTAVTCSDGSKLESSFYRETEQKIGQAQRRGHKKQAKRLHRKIKRQRAHALHTFSTRLIKDFNNIIIGDLKHNFIKTVSAKGAYDLGLGMLKTQLLYKGRWAGRSVELINEAYTTQACSACGALTGPAGRTGLVVREWQCGDCGASHDRDVNAAINICHFGMKHHPPSAGTSPENLIYKSSINDLNAGRLTT